MKFLATLSAFLFSGIVSAAPLQNIVIFGDSLSDNGNLYQFTNHQIPASPYYKGRFSNGPVWIEHLVASYFPKDPADHLLDYAYGLAGVSEEDGIDDVMFTLRREVNKYLLEHNDKASEDSLFVVWIGANNYLAAPPEVEQTLDEVQRGISNSLKLLVNKGAKHILVVNVPDLGRTPAAIEFDSVDTMTLYSKEHNRMLIDSVNALKEEFPGVEWLSYDVNQVFDDVIVHAANYGFTNVTGTCAFSANRTMARSSYSRPSLLRMVRATKSKKTQDACTGYLFFDQVHPSALAHKILADKARAMLDQNGIVFTH